MGTLEKESFMHLPIVFRPLAISLPPMYTWPRSVKRVLLAFSALLVIAAYALLAGGIVAALAVLTEIAGS